MFFKYYSKHMGLQAFEPLVPEHWLLVLEPQVQILTQQVAFGHSRSANPTSQG